MLRGSLPLILVGTQETIRGGLQRFIEKYRTDERMVTGHIFDHAARLRSFEIVAQLRDELAPT